MRAHKLLLFFNCCDFDTFSYSNVHYLKGNRVQVCINVLYIVLINKIYFRILVVDINNVIQVS